MPPVRVVNLAHPEYHGLSAIGPPGSREAAAERLLGELVTQGYRLIAVTADGLAVLELPGTAAPAAAA